MMIRHLNLQCTSVTPFWHWEFLHIANGEPVRENHLNTGLKTGIQSDLSGSDRLKHHYVNSRRLFKCTQV